MKVLIVDDEKEMLKILSVYFEKEGFEVYLCNNGEDALRLLYNEVIDLCILDWMMPGIDGLEVCIEAKKINKPKVIMLTAKSEIEDEWRALRFGADDYIRKPFDPRILILRAKKMLKIDSIIKYKDLAIDIKGCRIYKAGIDLKVTQKEFKLMICLIENKGRIVQRETLLDYVWGYLYDGDQRTLDTHMRRLREKIGESYIETRRGIGYSMVSEDD